MKFVHMSSLQSIVPPDQAVTVWLTSGEMLTGTGYTWDINGIAQLYQNGDPAIVIDLEHVAAIQSAPLPPAEEPQ